MKSCSYWPIEELRGSWTDGSEGKASLCLSLVTIREAVNVTMGRHYYGLYIYRSGV